MVEAEWDQLQCEPVAGGAGNTIGTAIWNALWRRVSAPIALFDMRGHIVEANPAMCRMLGYAREQLLQSELSELMYPGASIVDRKAIAEVAVHRPDGFSEETRLVRSDGTVVWVLINSAPVQEPAERSQLILSQFFDITGQRAPDQIWRQALAAAPVGMALTDLRATVVEVNDKLCRLIGYSRDELIGRATELAYQQGRERLEALYAELREGRAETGSSEFCMRHRDGHPFWLLARLSLVRGADDQPTSVIGQYEPLGTDTPLSAERLAELTRKALHDPLTGLANRALLIDRFQQEMAELPKQLGMLAMLVIDLDGFKEINDRHGHLVGDEVLQSAAHQLLDSVRRLDTVARLGGDEFVVLARVSDQDQAEALRTRIAQRLNLDAPAPGHPIALSASVGLVTTSDPSTSCHTLLSSADRDMYARKRVRPEHGRTESDGSTS